MSAEPVASADGDASSGLPEYTSVRIWRAGLRSQSRVDLDADPQRLEALRAFCAYVGKDPDSIIRECLREVDEQVKISYKGRKLYATKIAEFEQLASNGHVAERTRIGSTLRSFLIHNGIFLQVPALLR